MANNGSNQQKPALHRTAAIPIQDQDENEERKNENEKTKNEKIEIIENEGDKKPENTPEEQGD